MIVRVVSVRDYPAESLRGHDLPFIYVGRRHFSRDLPGHPLANPYRLGKGATDADRVEALGMYRRWLEQHPRRDALLQALALAVYCNELPLACWCGAWDGMTEPAPLCHAVLLARTVRRLIGGEEAHGG